jgi:hypothetical protein
MDTELAKLLLAIIIGLGGWYIVHWLTSIRDQENRRNNLKIEYLLKAYRTLSNAANRSNSEEFYLQFEEAVSDIQLLGSPKQVELLHTALSNMASSGNHLGINDVFEELRIDLRNELALAPISIKAKYFRFDRQNSRKTR